MRSHFLWHFRCQLLGRLSSTASANVRTLCLGLLCAFSIGQVHALGLGEIDLNSALNEKLSAEIELIEPGTLQENEILVSLASREDFERVGVERFFFLTDMKFKVGTSAQGKRVIQVSSSQTISEPYLNFLVEVLWPNGRLLKEYTLLLDPPTFAQAAAPQVSAPVQNNQVSQSRGSISRQPIQSIPRESSRPSRVNIPASTTRPTASRTAANGMTSRGDTLWEIAAATRAPGVDINQQMLAIKRLNADAFIRDNINWLKAGHVLRMPAANEALSVASTDALAQVQAETNQWLAEKGQPTSPLRIADRGTDTSGRLPDAASQESQSATGQAPVVANSGSSAKGQIDATGKTTGEKVDVADAKGQLKIVAGEGDSVQGSTNPDANPAMAAILEERDRLTRELEEVTYQMDREQELAGSQLAVKDRQLEVKDQQIAALQQQLQDAQNDVATQTPVGADVAENQNQNAQAQTAWWQSNTVMFGGVAALVLALIGGLFVARKRRAEPADEYLEDFTEDELTVSTEARVEPEMSSAAFADDETVNLNDSDNFADGLAGTDDFSSTADLADDDQLVLDDLTGDSAGDAQAQEASDAVDAVNQGRDLAGTDVIGEADIYIAYGRYPQAISLLLSVLGEEPARHDVRHKLLELYAETNDKDAFQEHMSALSSSCYDEELLSSAQALEAKVLEANMSTVDDAPSVKQLADSTDEDLDRAIAAARATDDESDDFDISDLDAEADGDSDFLDFDFEDELEADGDLEAEVENALADSNDDAGASELAAEDEFEFSELEQEADDLDTEFDGLGELGDNLDDDSVVDTANETLSQEDGSEDLGGDLGMAFDEIDDAVDAPAEDLDQLSDTLEDEAIPSLDESMVADADDSELEFDLSSLDEFDEFDDDLADTDNAGSSEAASDESTQAAANTELDDLSDLDFTADGDAEGDFADDDFDFETGEDSTTTKLDLAKAYIDMGDGDGARDILQEVLSEGNDGQQQEAQVLLESI